MPQSTHLGFDTLLAHAAEDNARRVFERETAHLPDRMDEGIGHFRDLIAQNHTAMLAADVDTVGYCHAEARRLAIKLNGGDSGYLAHDDAPGCVLAKATAAKIGAVPKWGQTGEFVIEVAGMNIRVEMEGQFGIGSGFGFWPGFAAHVVDRDKPFLSETGYRSFLGIHADPVPGHTPESFAAMIVERYVNDHLSGKLLPVISCEEWSKG